MRNKSSQALYCLVLALALAACSGVAVPPPPTPDPAAAGSAHNHPHGEGGAGDERLFTRYGGPIVVEVTTQPEKPQPGSEFKITYTLKDEAGDPVTPDKLKVAHERTMHLIVVSQDLRYFSHIHPQDAGNGRYEVSETLPGAGKYLLYNEFVTADGVTQVERHLIATEGAGEVDDPATLTPDLGEAQQVSGLSVSAAANTPKIRRRMPATFTLTVTRDGEAVTDLEPFLGAPAHMVIISADTEQFAHTHAEAGSGAAPPGTGHAGHAATSTPQASFGPDIQFTHTFMQPGAYRIWAQFGYRGEVVTVGYNVEVGK